MIDYFALLEQPRRPWLDQDELKTKYHEKTRAKHPDIQPDEARDSESFAAINEAYQVLQDPKRRLRHLLTLEGLAPAASNQEIPSELADLFPITGAATQDADRLLQKTRASTTALGRSLLKPELLTAQSRTEAALQKLTDSYDISLSELQKIDGSWTATPDALVRLNRIYTKITYLARWIAELEERKFQLSVS